MSARWTVLVLVTALSSVLSLTDVDRSCLSAHGGAMNNDFLVGTWYEIYHISKDGPTGRSWYCRKQIIRKLRNDEIHHYEFLFKILNVATKLVNPLYTRDSNNSTYGVLSGADEAKIFLMDPKYLLWRPDHTEGRVYKYIDDNYLLYHRCEEGDERKLLLSRSREPDDEEVKKILDRPDLKKYLKQKYCSKY